VTYLVHPIAAPPPGARVAVAPGVHWIRMPLPFRLDHINVWAIEDGDGWVMVDTGVRSEETVATWKSLMARPPLDRPLRRVIATHMHLDHVGLAGWLTRRLGIELWMSKPDYLWCRTLMSDTGREAPEDALSFYRRAGWSYDAIDAYRMRFGDIGNHTYALPDSFRRLSDGQTLQIGGDTWEVVTGLGHSPEHACLYCAQKKLFISGDQVLPRISSNLSVHPMESSADPMADWYVSMEKILRRVPDDVLVMPAHGECFHGLHGRVTQLLADQDDVLAALRAVLAEPKRVVDTFGTLFRRPVSESDGKQLGLATGEAVACLNYLSARGEIDVELRDGVAWYSRRDGGGA